MYRRRRHSQCLNCGAQLDDVYNYCPLCGQENTDNKVSFKTLISDFFNNYLSFDSRFGNTVKPFLIKPGLITNEFLEGHRVTFMHPIRLYLVLSLFYFFILSLPSTNEDKTTTKDGITTTEIAPGIKVFTDNDSVELAQAQENTKIITSDNIDATDTLDIVDDFNITGSDNFWILTKENMEIFQDLRYNRDFTDKQVLDSLDTEEMSFWEILLAKQMIRVARSEQENLSAAIYKNLPIMMFFILPVFALILMALYFRRKNLYIEHLIHALHLHSFIYFLFGTSLLLTNVLFSNEVFEATVVFATVIIAFVYVFKSFRRVYKQKWFKTLLKFFILSFTYFFALMIATMIELTISLLMY